MQKFSKHLKRLFNYNSLIELLLKVKDIVIGKPLLISPKIKDHIALISIFAWIGLGADGLSSTAYGPAEAYLALGTHTSIAIYLAIAMAVTVFLISMAYSQVIELFPNGGGGYKVATNLIGEKAGVVSGSALIIDYVLTISVSVASGVDAIFSLLPTFFLHYKLEFDLLMIILLMVLNLRGIKESIKILTPLFIGFVITHVFIIVTGVLCKTGQIHAIWPEAVKESSNMSQYMGLFASIALCLKAYSLGGGTYTGLEAVSNNVNMLAEPRVRTGKITMLYMAFSLSFVGGGITLVYLLWQVAPLYGQTLNAVAFGGILDYIGWNSHFLIVILFFEAALLFLGANTGFLACPNVIANMAADKWLPKQFRKLSDRLVTQNGILISGIASIIILLWARGKVSTLVILYSINVFLTFSLSLLGLCRYHIKNRRNSIKWIKDFIVAIIGLALCVSILIITTVEKFADGAWMTLLITICTINLCFFIRRHYRDISYKLTRLNQAFSSYYQADPIPVETLLPVADHSAKTAVFFVNKHYGVGINMLLWVKANFPGVFKNFVFVTAGEVDMVAFTKDSVFKKAYRQDLDHIIENYRHFCTSHELPSQGYFSYGVDDITELLEMSEQIKADFPDSMFFGAKLVFTNENFWTRLLHNNTINNLQRELQLAGFNLIMVPLQIP